MTEAARAILFALATRRLLAADELGLATGHPSRVLDAALAELAQGGLVAPSPSDASRLRLTPQGEEQALAAVATERAALAAQLAPLYLEFAPLNRDVKAAVSRWQLGSGHASSLLGELGGAHRRALLLLDRLAGLRPRYASLRARLASAMARVEAGETSYVAGVTVDSFHSVWWQLHADLLAVLGRERGEADL